ncbi:MAG: ethanolamine utilization microcompartment protein EutS [Aminipila sp.]
MEAFEQKERIIQEFVPGKQVTLAHVIPHPVEEFYPKVGLVDAESKAVGIFTITPSEAALIAVDVACKAADVKIGFVDRFNGSVIITGDVAAVEASIREVISVLCDSMGFSSTEITKS